MTSGSPDQPQQVAVAQLEDLGLSTYAARTFVALVRLGVGTARDVANTTDVPRTRVYDAVDELNSRGMVDIQQSTPKRFWAVSAETTGRQFDHEYTQRVQRLLEALDQLETVSPTEEQRGVWTVTGTDTITQRVADFIQGADEEVVYMTVEELLTDDIVDAIESVADRDVDVRLAGMSDDAETTLREKVPDAEMFESMWEWSEAHAGRLLMVDQNQTLVSVLTPMNGEEPGGRTEETAIWGSGDANGLVVVLRAIFTWHLNGNRD